mgnify:CR=1 FL=1
MRRTGSELPSLSTGVPPGRTPVLTKLIADNRRDEVVDRIRAQMAAKDKVRLQISSRAYLEFLRLGGDVRMEDMTGNLLRPVPIAPLQLRTEVLREGGFADGLRDLVGHVAIEHRRHDDRHRADHMRADADRAGIPSRSGAAVPGRRAIGPPISGQERPTRATTRETHGTGPSRPA